MSVFGLQGCRVRQIEAAGRNPDATGPEATIGQHDMTPVYKGAFNRKIHEVPCAYDPELALNESFDFGKHHPCMRVMECSFR